MANPKVSTQVLEGTLGYIRQGWTQHVAARDGAGGEISPLNEDAASWCYWGAMNRAAYDVVSARYEDRPQLPLRRIDGEVVAAMRAAGGYLSRHIIDVLDLTAANGPGKQQTDIIYANDVATKSHEQAISLVEGALDDSIKGIRRKV